MGQVGLIALNLGTAPCADGAEVSTPFLFMLGLQDRESGVGSTSVHVVSKVMGFSPECDDDYGVVIGLISPFLVSTPVHQLGSVHGRPLFANVC